MRRFVPVVMLITLLLAALPGAAQDDPPLIAIMKMVPAQVTIPVESRDLMIQYADFRANEAARPGVMTPESWTHLRESGDVGKLWNANLQRILAGAPELGNLGTYRDEMVDYYGFGKFEIDRSFYFGPPPGAGAIYGGDFDVDRIVVTMTGRTYTTTELNGLTVLCGPIGCENGEQTNEWLPDQGERDPETFALKGVHEIFGDRLGQQQPIALLEGYILSTPNWERLGLMTAATAGEVNALYDLSEYRAIADFAVSDYDLIQVIFFPPQLNPPNLLNQMLLQAGQEATEENLNKLREAMGLDATGKPLGFEDLPVYPLGAIVDQQDGSDQLHSLVLVYQNEGAAQSAAAEMARRIPVQSAYLQLRTDEPLIDLALGDRPYTVEPGRVVYMPEIDRWLAVATVRTPVPDNEPNENGNILPSGRLLSLWYRSMSDRDFAPVQLFGADE